MLYNNDIKRKEEMERKGKRKRKEGGKNDAMIIDNDCLSIWMI